jgi:alanine racemase
MLFQVPPEGASTTESEVDTEGIRASAEHGGASRRSGARLTVDLGAIRDNYLYLRTRLGFTTCSAVVKADAYGLGAAQIAPVLQRAGCRTFFVAHLDEAIVLRASLAASSAIHILNGVPPGAEPDCVAAGSIPVLNSLEQLSAWRRTAAVLGRRLPATIQVDSGMARLGLSAGEVEQICNDPLAFEGLDLQLIMSHLACADEPDHPANVAQHATFEAMRARLPMAPASLANSAGIFLGSAYHFDLARPGAALYGVNPTPGRPNPMRAVVQLSAKVIQVRDVAAGAAVGYGYSFRATSAARIAAISLGYADGWHRNAATGAAAFFQGVRLPFAGRVSMDSITLDVSALPATLTAGNFVDLIGDRQTLADVARLAGTIEYEILTGLGRRFERRYVGT